MKNMVSKKFINNLFICLACSVLLLSCGNKKEEVVFEQTITFNNSNWDFTQRNLEFDGNISDTIAPYRIEAELKYGPDDERVDEMPLSFAITGPDGAKHAVQSGFIFNNDPENTDIAKETQKASQTQSRIIYEKKYFNCSGTYHFRISRYSPKFDNYNIQSLTIRVVKLAQKD